MGSDEYVLGWCGIDVAVALSDLRQFLQCFRI